MGLATDYCVKFTVLDALDLGYTVSVITDGCRGVNIQPGTVQTPLWKWRQRVQRCIRWTTGWKPSRKRCRQDHSCRRVISGQR